jgi:dTMP kinase
MNRPGFLLVLEGIDGSGKSTLARQLAGWLRAQGREVITSREPTDGPHGAALRQSAKAGRLSLADELDHFLKDRAEHVEKLITPALARGATVILDRYYFSTAAYQGARGADPAVIIARNEAFAPVPDLVLLLDLDPAAGASRILRRGDELDDFEALDYQREVRRIFLSLDRPNLHRLDAARAAETVFSEARALLERALLQDQRPKSSS